METLEEHIVIDNNRFIHVPDEIKRIAVQNDNLIETVTFDCPRYWDGHDLSTMYIFVIYVTPLGVKDRYLVDNVRIDTEDTQIIHFDWTITDSVSVQNGDLVIAVEAKETLYQDVYDLRWYTEMNKEMFVSDGFDGSEDTYARYPDVINDLLTRMDDMLAADTPILDTSLTQAGLAAESKATGDAINAVGEELTEKIEDTKVTINIKMTADKRELQNNINTEISNRTSANINLQNQINTLASGSPKGVYATTSALKTANPETGVYIVTADGHIYSWTKNQSGEPIDLGVYQSTGIADKSINQSMLDDEIMENFDKAYFYKGTQVDKFDNRIGTAITRDRQYACTVFPRIWFPKGTEIEFIGNRNTFKWAIVEFGSDYSTEDILSSNPSDLLKDSGWISADKYITTYDSYFGMTLQYNSSTETIDDEFLSHMGDYFIIKVPSENLIKSFNFDNSLNYGHIVDTDFCNFKRMGSKYPANTLSSKRVVKAITKELPAGTKIDIKMLEDHDIKIGIVETKTLARNNNVFVDSGWITSDSLYITRNKAYIFITIAYTDDREMSDADFHLLDEAVIIYSNNYINNNVNDINNKVDLLALSDELKNYNLFNTKWELGSVGNTTGTMTSSTTRIRFFKKIWFKKGTLIKFTDTLDNLDWSYQTWPGVDDLPVIENSGWLKTDTFIAEYDAYYCLVVRYHDNRTIQDADVESLSECIKMYRPILNYANRLIDWYATEKPLQITEKYTQGNNSNNVHISTNRSYWLVFFNMISFYNQSNWSTTAKMPNKPITFDLGSYGTVTRTNEIDNIEVVLPTNYSLVLNVVTGVMKVINSNDLSENEALLVRNSNGNASQGAFVEINNYWKNKETLQEIEDIKSDIAANANANYDVNVKGVAHRGFSTIAPENTLPSYKLARQKGFKYVECDVSFTSDGVPVLLHDNTINRTSNGTGNIGDLTFEQVRTYDFGSWKSSNYAGTQIPSFKEFILLCRNIGLHPYIELKDNATYTENQIRGLVDTVKKCGMSGKITWISFSKRYLEYVKNYDDKARLGYIATTISDTKINEAITLRTTNNEVFIDTSVSNLNSDRILLCINNNLPLEVWTVTSQSTLLSLDEYITGVTSNDLLAGKILYDHNMA